MENKKHMVTRIVVAFSGGVNGFNAESVATYSLTAAGKKGSFAARNARHFRVSSAIITPTLNQVTLKPIVAVALTKPVQLVINGQAPGGMQAISGGFIDGNDEGHAGDDGVFVITRSGVTRD